MRTSVHVLSEEEFAAQIDTIEQALDLTSVEHTVTTFDRYELYVRLFPVENSRGVIVIVHGLSEFFEKFYELSWYFNQQGYSVLVYDQRGHGHSSRLIAANEVIHVDRFDDYADDLHRVIQEVAVPFADDKPLYLFGHSMGGAVVCLYLAAHPDTPVQKAVLTAPLMVPNLKRMPLCLARMGTAYEWRKAGGGAVASALSHPFNPNAKHENSPDISRARFDHNLRRRCSHERYQTVMKSIGWNREALYIGRRLLSRTFAASIQTPILLLSAEDDTIVKTRPHHRFATRCNACRLHTIKRAKHCLFTGDSDVYTTFLNQTLDFLDESV